eukprot:gnl/TRDRNA2_/TRDRNA2_129603_c0_seq1.p1 gnl/TRDRNA2_/TRDRNA2_129603_c0~~gnl/TRDRNA2_/TRDRNA2_129603_c0_seq1.p1  ORF type:complete len:460 (+),score=74.01 gnl/TRDRNA2_/TRDRNA2_129603_c0_seq1:33-1412(+)
MEDLSMNFRALQDLALEKNGLRGLNPLASTAYLAPNRLEGAPGYGRPGPSARAYYELACRSNMLSQEGMQKCKRLTDGKTHRADPDTSRKVELLKILRHIYSDLFARGVYIFWIALQLYSQDWMQQMANQDQRAAVEQLPSGCIAPASLPDRLASELEAHHFMLAHIVQGLEKSAQKVFIPRLGTLVGALMQRAAGHSLLDTWKRAVEHAVEISACGLLVYELAELALQIIQEAVLLLAHMFAHFYLTELREDVAVVPSSHETAVPEGVAVSARQHFEFHADCCFRYQILVNVINSLEMSSPTMLEVGVHTGQTGIYLLDKIPSLLWVGIDSYPDYTEGSGDAMFAETSAKLQRYGNRARLVRSPSSVAWGVTAGGVIGLEPASLDLIFLDGDHDAESVKKDLSSWSRFLRPGGIMCGHDIFNPVNDGVTDGVLDFLDGKDIILHLAPDHVFWWHLPDA